MTKLRILVAEDEPLISMMLVEMLEAMGHVVCASSWTEVETVKAALAVKPDLMIVDARLSTGSGVAAVATILTHGFVPHIFASGDILRDDTLSPRAVTIRKPYRESDLADAIRRAFQPPPKVQAEFVPIEGSKTC